MQFGKMRVGNAPRNHQYAKLGVLQKHSRLTAGSLVYFKKTRACSRKRVRAVLLEARQDCANSHTPELRVSRPQPHTARTLGSVHKKNALTMLNYAQSAGSSSVLTQNSLHSRTWKIVFSLIACLHSQCSLALVWHSACILKTRCGGRYNIKHSQRLFRSDLVGFASWVRLKT